MFKKLLLSGVYLLFPLAWCWGVCAVGWATFRQSWSASKTNTCMLVVGLLVFPEFFYTWVLKTNFYVNFSTTPEHPQTLWPFLFSLLDTPQLHEVAKTQILGFIFGNVVSLIFFTIWAWEMRKTFKASKLAHLDKMQEPLQKWETLRERQRLSEALPKAKYRASHQKRL